MVVIDYYIAVPHMVYSQKTQKLVTLTHTNGIHLEIIILPITQPIRWVNLITSDQKQEIAASSKQHNTKCTRNTT